MTPSLRLPNHLLHHCKVIPDRETFLWFVPKNKLIVEIGVGLGDFSVNFLTYCEPAHFIGVDLFDLHLLDDFWGKPARELFGARSHLEYYTDKLAGIADRSRFSTLQGDSSSQLRSLENKSVGLFYVDGDHTYDGVWRDLSIIREKVATDGIIMLNDYVMRDDTSEYGVVQAVNEFMVSDNWEMLFFCLQPMMYCDVVLRRVGMVP